MVLEFQKGENSGAEEGSAVETVGAAIDIADAVTMKHIADTDKFTEASVR
ncbi:MAG TPA: hypothetical protein VNU92_14535 [Edaphobacter sp.]|nr:hypothetical protein [Edaphobacter sp.]